MDTSDRVLYHQIHPAKIGTDLAAEIVSLWLIWNRHYRSGVVIHLVSPVVASAIVTSRTDELERIRDSPAGRYLRREMTPQMQAVRLLGDAITVFGAWRRRPAWIVAGALIVVAGWTLGGRRPKSSAAEAVRASRISLTELAAQRADLAELR